MSTLLFVHILAGSALLLLAVARFLIVVLAHRIPSTLLAPVLGLAVLQLSSGCALIVLEQASMLHLCLSAAVSLAFLALTEVWLQVAHRRQYSESSKEG